MNTQFSPLEVQLIRSSLSTKTDMEIAEVLERPVEEVRAKINEITGGAADERESDVKKYQEEKAQARIKKAKPAKAPKIIRKKEAPVKKPEKQVDVEKVWEQQKAQARMREARLTFQTKPVDLTGMISVRIDHRTTIFVKPGTDIEQAKHNYQLQRLKQQAIKD